MSYQRAVINCRRCYERSTRIESREGVSREEWLSLDSRLSEFRERAMQALEEIPRGIRSDREKSLTACLNCRYEKPEIEKIFFP